jgi:hypothetical protein
MGTPKGQGYTKKTTVTPEQETLLNQYLQQAGVNTQQAAEGYRQFLPGGGGGQPIIDAAQRRFQQQTVPSILNAYGTDNKGSSALNQALAAGAANLNSDIAAQLAQMQLQASQGLGNLGTTQGQLASKDQFAYLQRATPFWQSATLAAIDAAGKATAGYLGKK